jgi:hypothetical protein
MIEHCLTLNPGSCILESCSIAEECSPRVRTATGGRHDRGDGWWSGEASGSRFPGSLSDLTFDNQEFGAAGGRRRLESRQAGAAKGGYEIQIAGGAAHVQVTTE